MTAWSRSASLLCILIILLMIILLSVINNEGHVLLMDVQAILGIKVLTDVTYLSFLHYQIHTCVNNFTQYIKYPYHFRTI